MNESPGPPVCPKPCIETYKTNFVSKTDSNLNMEEINRFYEKQQCLDYLGDEKASSPEQICKKSSREISNKLRILRLTHCCERNVYSSLHNEGMTAVTNGGKGCEQVLQKLIDTDALAGRITCGLNEILFRYDCRQVYSIKHQCTGCKVIIAYSFMYLFAAINIAREYSHMNENAFDIIVLLSLSLSHRKRIEDGFAAR